MVPLGPDKVMTPLDQEGDVCDVPGGGGKGSRHGNTQDGALLAEMIAGERNGEGKPR